MMHVPAGAARRLSAAVAVAWCLQLPLAHAAHAADAAADVANAVWVRKSERVLHLLKDYEIVRSYPIALGKSPVGHKLAAGDARTPEGLYLIDWRNPDSRFHLSLRISYPHVNDLRRGARRGVHVGDGIMIHGQPNDAAAHGWPQQTIQYDWTDGCIALSNRDVEEVWRLVADGTPILIEP